MADVTISSLPLGTPSGNALLPYSQGGQTLAVAPSGVVSGGVISGTWTPVLYLHSTPTNTDVFGYTGSVASTKINTYSKIGNVVYFNCSFDISGTQESVLRFITGLPFLPKSTGSSFGTGDFYKTIKGYQCSLGHCRGIGGRYGGSIADSIYGCHLSATVSDDLTQPLPIGAPYIYLWAAATWNTPVTFFWRIMPTTVENNNRAIFISGTYLTDQ